ncbi:MAG TPA: FtsQ-type POTRA domain-containing protein [Candidatus Acidoferrales bacterium]|nr:FtsQ-type POTRA domain-containing protein [Candidatus Acidoferrales bacterium]
MKLPVRRAVRRRSPAVQRASAGIPARRIAAGVVAIAAAGAIYGAAASPAFQLKRLDLEGARYTSQSAVDAALGLTSTPHPNLFSLDTARLRRSLLALPTVSDAQVAVELPDRLVVHIAEPRPILVWATSGARWLVDVAGLVIAAASPADPATSGLPVFADDRTGRAPVAPGGTLDPTDLAVARRLGALTPRLLGSAASGLSFEVNDADGFAIASVPKGWLAVFGMYTATLRAPDLIPSQMQCLSSLLAQVGERRVGTVYLFPEGDQCGTYTTR